MVILNSQVDSASSSPARNRGTGNPQASSNRSTFGHLKFSHVVKLPRANCAIVTARDRSTGKTHVFLLVNDSENVYQRNGLKSSWELQLEDEARDLTERLSRSIKEDQIPCYSTEQEIDL